MQCYAPENLVTEDFTLHRSSTKICTEIMKGKFLTSGFFPIFVQLKYEGVDNKCNILTIFEHFEIKTCLNCLILHSSCSVEEKDSFH